MFKKLQELEEWLKINYEGYNIGTHIGTSGIQNKKICNNNHQFGHKTSCVPVYY